MSISVLSFLIVSLMRLALLWSCISVYIVPDFFKTSQKCWSVQSLHSLNSLKARRSSWIVIFCIVHFFVRSLCQWKKIWFIKSNLKLYCSNKINSLISSWISISTISTAIVRTHIWHSPSNLWSNLASTSVTLSTGMCIRVVDRLELTVNFEVFGRTW